MSVIKSSGTSCSRKEEVQRMFDAIAPRYDFLNRFLSLGIDRSWRKKTIQKIAIAPGCRILDVATGTADLAVSCLKLRPREIIGIDISSRMLEKGHEKIRRMGIQNIFLKHADIMDFQDSEGFDLITVAFGIRNMEDPDRALLKMYELLKNGGQLAILEFSGHGKGIGYRLFRFYFHTILPFLGRIISGNDYAYTYLPQSVDAFPSGRNFEKMLEKAGFHEIRTFRFSGGICFLYLAGKSTN